MKKAFTALLRWTWAALAPVMARELAAAAGSTAEEALLPALAVLTEICGRPDHAPQPGCLLREGSICSF